VTEALAIPGVRVLPSEIGPVIPVVDIISNIGYSRSSVTKALNRHPDMFKGLTTFQPIDTRRGSQQGQCLNGAGVRNLILLLQPSAESKPDLRARVEAFKAEQYGKLEETEKAPVPDLLESSLLHYGRIGNILIKEWECPADVARRLAMAAVVEECGESAVRFRGPFLGEPAKTVPPALPAPGQAMDSSIEAPDPDFERYFSMQKVAEMCQCSRNEAVNILEKEGVIAYANGIWHLTRLGEQFGKAFPTYPLFPQRLTRKMMIRYSPAAVNLVRGRLNTTQTALPAARAGVS